MQELNVKKAPILSIKKIIICFLGLIILSFGTTIGISIYVGWSLTHPAHNKIVETPVKYDLKYENVSFNSKLDAVDLKGWWIPAQKNNSITNSGKTVIFAHGYKDTRDLSKIHALALAKRIAQEGYNVMMFDFRNSGESGGEATSVGLFETYDMLSAIEYAKVNKKSEKISLLGWSMGAAVSIIAGTESPYVNTIIADSPFSDLDTYLKTNLPVWSDLPSFPFTAEIMSLFPVIERMNPKKVTPYKAVDNIGNKKLFLIHSKDDKSIPYENSIQIYNSVKDKSNTELWLTDKADHIRSYLLYKNEYENRVITFLNKG
jgi:Prolyl oligopeptidase family.